MKKILLLKALEKIDDNAEVFVAVFYKNNRAEICDIASVNLNNKEGQIEIISDNNG